MKPQNFNRNLSNTEYDFSKITKPKRYPKNYKKYYVVLFSPEPYDPNEIELNTFDENSIDEAVDFYTMIYQKHHNDRYITLVEEVRENGLCLHDLYKTIRCHVPDIRNWI